MSIGKKEEKKKPNWERRVFWATLVSQIVLFIIVILANSEEIYKMAYKFAHVFLIIMLINAHILVKSSNYWEKMYTELLDADIDGEEVKEVD